MYKSNKTKIIAPTWNDDFEVPEDSYSVSDIQDYIEYIINKHEELPTNPPIDIYINSSNGRLLFKIEDGYEVELQPLETMKLFGRTKQLIDKTMNG